MIVGIIKSTRTLGSKKLKGEFIHNSLEGRLPVLKARLDCKQSTIVVSWEKPDGKFTDFRITCRQLEYGGGDKKMQRVTSKNILYKFCMNQLKV